MKRVNPTPLKESYRASNTDNRAIVGSGTTTRAKDFCYFDLFNNEVHKAFIQDCNIFELNDVSTTSKKFYEASRDCKNDFLEKHTRSYVSYILLLPELPNFHRNKLLLPVTCYIHSVNNLKNPSCLLHKIAFDYNFSIFTNNISYYNFLLCRVKATKNEEAHYLIKCKQDLYDNIKFYDKDQKVQELVLSKIFHAYFTNPQSYEDAVCEKRQSNIKLLAEYIFTHPKSSEYFSNIINKVIQYIYEKIMETNTTSITGYNYILNEFVRYKIINTTCRLKDLIQSKIPSSQSPH